MIAQFLCFAALLTLIANNTLYQLFLESRYVRSTEVVAVAGQEITQISQPEQIQKGADDSGLFESGVFDSLGDVLTGLNNHWI